MVQVVPVVVFQFLRRERHPGYLVGIMMGSVEPVTVMYIERRIWMSEIPIKYSNMPWDNVILPIIIYLGRYLVTVIVEPHNEILWNTRPIDKKYSCVDSISGTRLPTNDEPATFACALLPGVCGASLLGGSTINWNPWAKRWDTSSRNTSAVVSGFL